jgi:hypothetical protein
MFSKKNANVENEVMTNHTPTNAAYVMFIDGGQHNVFVESFSDNYIIGKVALNKMVMLVSKPGKKTTFAKLVDSGARGDIAPGEELLMTEECVTPSKTLHIRVKTSSVSIIEDPWRTLLPSEAVGDDGFIDPKALCAAMPAFKEYYVEGRGFVCSPAAWEKPTVSKDGGTQDVHFQMVDAKKD